MRAMRAIRSVSLGRTKNKAALEPLPGEAAAFPGGARSAIAAARREVAGAVAAEDGSIKRSLSSSGTLSSSGRGLPPLPADLQSAAKGGLAPPKLPSLTDRTAAASEVYGVDASLGQHSRPLLPGQMASPVPGAIKKRESRIPSAGRSLLFEVGGGIRRRKVSASACLKPLDAFGSGPRAATASPEPQPATPRAPVGEVAPWERELFPASAKLRAASADPRVQTPLSAKSQFSAKSQQRLACSPMTKTPSSVASGKPSPVASRPPSMPSRPSPRSAASPRPQKLSPKAAAAPPEERVAGPTPRSDVEQRAPAPSAEEAAAPLVSELLAPAEAAARKQAVGVFRDLFAEELRVCGGDANEAAAAALRRLAAGKQV